MAKIILTFEDNEAEDYCLTQVTSDPKDALNVLDMKLMDMKPSQTCLYMCIEAVKKLKKLTKIQTDQEAIFEKDPGYIKDTTKDTTYH